MTCSDGVNSVSGDFVLTIDDIPQGSVLPSQTLLTGTAMTSYTLPANTFTDFDAETVTAAGLPPGVTYSSATDTFSGTPTTAGVYPVTLTATDKYGATNTTTITFTVRANVAPIFSPALTN